jgi:hypothetical protein
MDLAHASAQRRTNERFSGISPTMIRCSLCHDQAKQDDDARVAFEFTPKQLHRSAYTKRCESCLVILEGLRQSETPEWSFQRDIRIVYAICHDKLGSFRRTLRLEIYFIDDRPKLELEYYSLQPHRKLVLQNASTTNLTLYQRGKASYHGRQSAVTHSLCKRYVGCHRT